MSRRRDERTRAARKSGGRSKRETGAVREKDVGRTGGAAALDDGLLLRWMESRVRGGVRPSDLDNYAALSGAAFTGSVTVPDEAYGAGWNGSLEVPTKNALYDKIETLVAPVMLWNGNNVYNLSTTYGAICSARWGMNAVPVDGSYKLYVRYMQFATTGTSPTLTIKTPTSRTLVAMLGSTARTLVAANTSVGTGTRLNVVSEMVIDCGTYALYAGENITNDNGNNFLLEAALSAGTSQCQTHFYLVKQ